MFKTDAFQEMLVVAKERLLKKSPEKIAKDAGVLFDEEKSAFYIESLDKKLELAYPSYEFSEKIGEWHQLVLLHYLDLADGTSHLGEYMSFSNMKDGLVRGTKFDHSSTFELEKFLKDKEVEDVKEICLQLHGKIKESKADLTVEFSFFPNCFLLINFWFADEEFPATAKLLIEKNADHYLTIEDAVTVGEVLLSYLSNTKVS